MLHFFKRELETLFVHRFSHGTMPFNFIFRKYVSEYLCAPYCSYCTSSFHYHVFGGLFLAYAIYSPTYGALSPYIRGTIRDDPTFLMACAAVFLVCFLLYSQYTDWLVLQFAQLSNGKTHLILRDLRPAGTKHRAIPHGYGFNLVSCPNYTFEILAWLSVCIMTGSYAGKLILRSVVAPH